MNSLILTAHDFRTPRKAGVHFVAEVLREYGPVRFFSLRYSRLSRFRQDHRTVLDGRANRVEVRDGVDCFLWRTNLHPFNLRRLGLQRMEEPLFRRYASGAPETLKRWIVEADEIFFESGISIAFFELVQQLNPGARTVYIASDTLEAINVADFIKREFVRVGPRFSAICWKSVDMVQAAMSGSNQYLVPHGFDATIGSRADPSPYGSGRNAVSVGSMLFDRRFFDIVAPAFPDVLFHVIGAGRRLTGVSPNVRVYEELPHELTLSYIKHATIGVAPYIIREAPRYLGETSLKLRQYDFFGLPAVCPVAVTGGVASRFGYASDTPSALIDAVSRALTAGRFPPRTFLPWRDVVARLRDPQAFSDTLCTRQSSETWLVPATAPSPPAPVAFDLTDARR